MTNYHESNVLDSTVFQVEMSQSKVYLFSVNIYKKLILILNSILNMFLKSFLESAHRMIKVCCLFGWSAVGIVWHIGSIWPNGIV